MVQNEFGLVYDMGTESESWEWVDLSKVCSIFHYKLSTHS